MQGMLNRCITKKLKQTIQRVPAVALLGPRQVGKTTLGQVIGQTFNAIYLDLESPADQLKLRDPLSFFSQHKDQLIILDEVHRSPNIFNLLRGVIDKHRQTGRKGEQFLLLGSASMDLLRQSSESLAGRIHYMALSGLNILELPNTQPNELYKLWLRGGFPNSYLATSDAESMEWLEMLIRTYLERDLPQIGFRIPADRLRRLWTMLAHLQGETLNYSKLASNLEVNNKTVTYYLDILVDLLLVRRLKPWHGNTKKRLIKSPRFYVRDSGLLHRLLDILDYDHLLSNPVLGKSWEGFVIENIVSILPSYIEPYYYCTASGAEIDLVLEMPNKALWAIEIKHGIAPKIKIGFHQAAEAIQATKKWVVYGGNETFPIGRKTHIISLTQLMKEIIHSTALLR